MEICKENVRLFVTSLGMIVGEFDSMVNTDTIKINFPMIVTPSKGGMTITTVWMKDKWMKINTSGLIELPVQEVLLNGYIEQVNYIHNKMAAPAPEIEKVEL